MWLRSLAPSRRLSAGGERGSATPPASPHECHALPATPTQRTSTTPRVARGSIAGVAALLQVRRVSREEDMSKGARRSLVEGSKADPQAALQGRLSRLERTQSTEQEVNIKCSRPKRNRSSNRARAMLAGGRSTSKSTLPALELDTWQGPPKMEFEMGDTVSSVALSDDDSMFAAGTIDRVARVWSAAGEELATVRATSSHPRFSALSSRGQSHVRRTLELGGSCSSLPSQSGLLSRGAGAHDVRDLDGRILPRTASGWHHERADSGLQHRGGDANTCSDGQLWRRGRCPTVHVAQRTR